MNIGFMGLGKLGLPVALAVESKGHAVLGVDPSERVVQSIRVRKLDYKEKWAQSLLDRSRLRIVDVPTLVSDAELLFVPIQTPHGPEYEGTTRIPVDPSDFDYSYLKAGIKTLSEEINRQQKPVVVIVISTVLPGTIRREIMPLIGDNPYFMLCYNPFFIAMGSTINDFLNPEFVLFGVDNDQAANKAEQFYRSLHKAPFYKTTLENAEAIKVFYNTFISTKIAFANTVMEMCHKLPNTNVDDVMNALKMAHSRIISDRYLEGGMGDGGGCHPRDNIALSWLANELELSYNWFEHVMTQRERQTEWLVLLIEEQMARIRRVKHSDEAVPIFVLGKAFKPETNIVTGSPSLLLKNLLEERGHTVEIFDPYVDSAEPEWRTGVYFVGTKHADFGRWTFPAGSIVLDPWRYLPVPPVDHDVTVVRIGDRRGNVSGEIDARRSTARAVPARLQQMRRHIVNTNDAAKGC